MPALLASYAEGGQGCVHDLVAGRKVVDTNAAALVACTGLRVCAGRNTTAAGKAMHAVLAEQNRCRPDVMWQTSRLARMEYAHEAASIAGRPDKAQLLHKPGEGQKARGGSEGGYEVFWEHMRGLCMQCRGVLLKGDMQED